MTWKLSPSDFAFLWDECRRCFYLKVVMGIPRPAGPFPKIFGMIDGAMRAHYADKPLNLAAAGAPAGMLDTKERTVESAPYGNLYIKGRTDGIAELQDGGYAVVDFKTSAVKGEYLPKYQRQLEAYAYALENAAGKGHRAAPVTTLGLLVFEPSAIAGAAQGINLNGAISWIPMERNAAAFLGFLDEVATVCDSGAPPRASAECSYCAYSERRIKV